MELKDQFRQSYAAGKEAVRTGAAKRPLWDLLIFSTVPIVGFLAIKEWLASHSSLSWGWQFAVAPLVACFLMIICSLALDKLRKNLGR
jgi:hypothetical protein